MHSIAFVLPHGVIVARIVGSYAAARAIAADTALIIGASSYSIRGA